MKYLPAEERGPLDAWLTEAIARQNADIAAKNLLAKTTAALQQKLIKLLILIFLMTAVSNCNVVC